MTFKTFPAIRGDNSSGLVIAMRSIGNAIHSASALLFETMVPISANQPSQALIQFKE